MLRTPARRAILSSLYLPQVRTRKPQQTDRLVAPTPHCTYPKPYQTNPRPHPQLLAWVDTFGRERVHVVTKEEMERAPEAVMAGVYKFLGLCAPTGEEAKEALTLPRENVRDGMTVPDGYGLTEADMLDLSEAFQPWNRALYSFLERHLSWPVRLGWSGWSTGCPRSGWRLIRLQTSTIM